jgi:cell division septum initiation protein DivIVA
VISMFAANVEVKEICGRKFRVVDSGLDEAEVAAFIGSLMDQNNELASKGEHLQSLTRLLEKVVLKAQEEADSISAEVDKKANAKANTVIAKAEEEARARAEMTIARAEEKAKTKAEGLIAEAQQRAEKGAQEKISLAEQQAREILKVAEEKAEAIKVPAEKEASSIVSDAGKKAEVAERQAREIVKAAEEKAEAIKVPAEMEASRIVAEAEQKAEAAEQRAREAIKTAEEKASSIETSAEKEAARIVLEAKEKAEGEALLIRQEAEHLLIGSREIVESEISAIREKFRKACEGLLEEATALSPGEGVNTPAPPFTLGANTSTKADAEAGKADAEAGKADAEAGKASERLAVQVEEGDQKESPALYQGAIELEIMPPISLAGILQLHRHLASTPEIKTLYVKGTANKGIIIRLFLRSPAPLLDVLEALPEVGRVSDKGKVTDRIKSALWKGSESTVRTILVTTTK